MNEFKGTPGPWEVDGTEIYPVEGHKASDAICEMKPGFSDADAALIAAAPELLESLQYAIEYATLDDSGNAPFWLADAIEAVAKALGEKP